LKEFLQLTTAMLVTITMQATAFAAVTAEEADQLGKNLTLWGAEMAGNAAGTIPPYTGGLPQNFTMPSWKKGSGRYEEGPYDNEKPLFTIMAANMDKYAAQMTPGQIALMKKYPDFRLNVYPTHRSVAWKSKLASYCKKNAVTATLTANGEGVAGDPYGCVPFPIPKNGYEVMWNSYLRPTTGYRNANTISNFLVHETGKPLDLVTYTLDFVRPYQDPNKDHLVGINYELRIVDNKAPASLVGQYILLWFSLDYNKQAQKAWFYTPGTRRMRLAPDLLYDTPLALYSGAMTADENNGFDGQPDRWDLKLIGKKELYVNYNANRALFAPIDKLLGKPGVLNPDMNRWELHRVWVVEATLKPGKRHRDSRRTLYFDEDSWSMLATEYYDQSGKLSRIGFNSFIPIPEIQGISFNSMLFYDLNKRTWMFGMAYNKPEMTKIEMFPDKEEDLSKWTAAAVEARGIR